MLYEKDGPIEAHDTSTNILDRWMISRTNETLREVTTGLEAYALDAAARPLMAFVDDLSTWYLRRSRDRFKGEDQKDAADARATLHFVLRTAAHMFAPFTPFMADLMWMRLRTDADPESVHLSSWPEAGEIDTELIGSMNEARRLVSLALERREYLGIRISQPLSELRINHGHGGANSIWRSLEKVIQDEVNVKMLRWNVDIPFEVELDSKIDDKLEEEGLVRAVIRSFQESRKQAGLTPQEITDVIKVDTNEKLRSIIEKNNAFITYTVRAKGITFVTLEGIPKQVIGGNPISSVISKS